MIECAHCGQVLDVANPRPGTQITCPICARAFVLGATAARVETSAPQSASPDGWHVLTPDGRRYGPESEETILGWIAEGRLPPGTRVWRAGFSEWLPIESTPPFAGQSRPAPRSAYGAAHATPYARAYGRTGEPASYNWVAIVSGFVVALCFFLPWIDVGIITVAGYRIPGLVSLGAGMSGNTEAQSKAFILKSLYLLPLLSIAGALVQFSRHSSRGLLSSLCGVGIILIMILCFGGIFAGSTRGAFDVLSIGFYGTVLGTLALSISAAFQPRR